jgi:hypothetical protein
MNIQGLIERYEKFKDSKKKLTSVDLVLKDLRSLDEPEPLPFKLKDVVRRIRGFDPTTQTRWLNDILKELGDDYGSMKYRSGYEQGKIEGAWVGNQLKDADNIRQELNKPVIPQVVADWIEVCKEHLTSSLSLAMTPSFLKSNYQGIELTLWIKKNEETFARAWLDGYEIQERKYVVTDGNHLYFKNYQEDIEIVILVDEQPGTMEYVKKFNTKEEAKKAADILGWKVQEVE